MKKTIVILGIVVIALAALGAGTVFAQKVQPTWNPAENGWGMQSSRGGGMRMGSSEPGAMHAYMVSTLAAKLGISADEINEALTAGSTMYQIALDNGIPEAEIPALLSEVHSEALALAVADGVLTQEQAEWMTERMAQRGAGSGTCPMNGGTPGSGMGRHGGQGMHGGWGGQQGQP